MGQGVVKFYNADKGFGFIAPEEGGDDVFLHGRNVEGEPPQEGDLVVYDIIEGNTGPEAINIQVLTMREHCV